MSNTTKADLENSLKKLLISLRKESILLVLPGSIAEGWERMRIARQVYFWHTLTRRAMHCWIPSYISKKMVYT